MPEPALKSMTIFPLPNDPEPTVPESPFAARLSEFEPLQRVEVLLRFGSPYKALEELQQIVSKDPQAEARARCYVRAGQIREQTRNMEAALACYEAAVSLEPQEPNVAYFALNNAAYCLNRMGRYAEAERAARRARDILPDWVNAHKNLGIALEELGRVSEAAESLLAAARIEPEHPVAMRRLRVLLASHPEIERERPAIASEVQALVERGRRDWPKTKPIPGEDLEKTVREFLSSIVVDDALVHGDFQIFGLRWDVRNGSEYLTLDEAMAKKILAVTEVSEAGSVPRIRVVNQSAMRIFLMAGEQLVGAKQNRVLNASILMDQHSDLPLPVSCVEAGRWAYRSSRFESKGSSSHYALRHMMAKKVHGFYKSRGTPESDQGEVWEEVSRKLAEHDTSSPSRALDDVYEKLGGRIEAAVEHLTPRATWFGAAFCFAGRIVGVDLFDRPATFQKLWPKLSRSYALDVLGRKGAEEVPRYRIERWIKDASRSLIDVFPSSGLGFDCRLESNHHVGSMLVVDGRPVHLEMFYEEEM